MRLINWLREIKKDSREHPNTGHHNIGGKDFGRH